MSEEEFRAVGWNWIQQHFKDYAKIRLTEEQAKAVFEHGEEKRLLKDCLAVRIRAEDSEDLTLIPQMFRKGTLASLESFSKEKRRMVPKNSPPTVFWKAFDDVLAIAREEG